MKLKHLLALLLWAFGVQLNAQSLVPGSIAFIGFQSDQPITFAFVNLVELEPNTAISFTDNKWGFDHLVTSEQTVIWTSPDTALPIGTIVTLRDDGNPNMPVIGPGTSLGRLYIMGGQGDQILAYTGPESNPSFIAGISNSNWQATCDSLPFFQFRTCLPEPLENGITAVSFTSSQSFNVDNGYLAITPLIVTGLENLTIINNANYWFLDNAEQANYTNWPNWNEGSSQPFASSIAFEQTTYQITEGGSQAVITLALSAPQFAPQTVVLDVLNFPGITSGDYATSPEIVNGTISLNVPANTLSVSFSVQALIDGVAEDLENITFSIASVSGGLAIGQDDAAAVSIISTEENFSQINFVSDTLYVDEGGLPLVVPMNISPASSQVYSVILTAFNGSGIQTDYFTTPVDFSGQLLLQTTANSGNLAFSVSTYNDFQIEADEEVRFSITTVSSGLQIGTTSTVVVIIRDNDNTPTVYYPELFINEVCSINADYPDENGQLDDWIEVYNADTGAVVMSGYKFTNNLNTPALFSIPPVSAQTTIQSQGFKVFWADQNTTQGPLHLNFTLNQSTGGLLALFAPDAETIIDQIAYPPMNAGESFGRLPDGGSDLAKLFITTPGAPNQDSLPPLFVNGMNSRDGMLSVFPNPAKEYVQLVKAGDKIDLDYNLQVLDMQGRRVEIEFQELKSGKAWLIHTNNLSPGLYLAALTTKNEKLIIQFVIQ
jgi:hypothetical protein